MRVDLHPLLMRWHRFMREVDGLPAHNDQTALITELGDWGRKLYKHLEKQDLLCFHEYERITQPGSPDGPAETFIVCKHCGQERCEE